MYIHYTKIVYMTFPGPEITLLKNRQSHIVLVFQTLILQRIKIIKKNTDF